MTDRSEMEREVAAELHRRGHYDDTADADEWMTREAAHAVGAALAADVDAAAAVQAVFVNSGLHDPTDPAEAACLAEDTGAVLDIVGRPAGRDPEGFRCP